jgi:hypothetical protein
MADHVEIKHLVKTPSFTGTKSLDGNQFRIWIRYNTVTEVWYMDLTMMRDSTVSIKGIALLPGKDLLAAHGYGNILGELWVVDTSGANENPTYEGMGDRWRIRYYPIGV